LIIADMIYKGTKDEELQVRIKSDIMD